MITRCEVKLSLFRRPSVGGRFYEYLDFVLNNETINYCQKSETMRVSEWVGMQLLTENTSPFIHSI